MRTHEQQSFLCWLGSLRYRDSLETGILLERMERQRDERHNQDYVLVDVMLHEHDNAGIPRRIRGRADDDHFRDRLVRHHKVYTQKRQQRRLERDMIKAREKALMRHQHAVAEVPGWGEF